MQTLDNGLMVNDGQAVGYVFNFQNAAFSPSGKVESDQAATDAHNKALADLEWQAMLKAGRGVLYYDSSTAIVSDWIGSHKIPAWRSRSSWHNMAGKNGRTDVWFNVDGSTWHGVNIGDNQILRVKRSK